MNAIQKIKTKLSAYPDVQYSESADGIDVHPRDQSGFTVGLRITPSGFTVNFDSWHEEFTSEDEALDCFAFGLSPKCRLAVVFVATQRPSGWSKDWRTTHGHRTPRPACSCSRFGGRLVSSTVRIACSTP
jgi:hypothetical protein